MRLNSEFIKYKLIISDIAKFFWIENQLRFENVIEIFFKYDLFLK